MTPTATEIRAHLAASGMRQDQMKIAFRAVDRAFEESLERFDREQERERIEYENDILKVIRGASA